MNSIEGKTAWITGGGGGIGEASAKALAEAGAHVVISGRREEELNRVTAEIRSAGGSAEAIALDVADRDAMKAAADAIADRNGGIDIHMANAGINVKNRSTDGLTMEDWNRVVDVNLNGVMAGVLACLPHLRAVGGGTIILTSSWAGRHASKLTGPAYNATKHAVVALAHSLNQEEAKNMIRTTALMPGEVATPILQSRPVVPTAEEQARMLQSEDLGRTVRFICEQPPHVCFNEILISPTLNRLFTSIS